MDNEQKQLTLGSLFDGIGGFPLAGIYAGMKPIWASEIEPFPIRVVEKRLPEVKHYGDVSKLHGGDLEPVDVVTFGSPCTAISVAGLRRGLHGKQSVLFFQAVRIIREMREKTNGQYPRWAVWENVPGALSSQNGRDFREVLESLVRIKDPTADVPMPEGGKWLPAGEIMGDGYSLAWRVLDAAQGWGVAQRRKRIFAVLDLDGQCAGKVLFESEGLSGYTPPGAEARQGAARSAEESAGETGTGISGASGFCTEHSADSRGVGYEVERSPTLRAGVVPGIAIQFNPTDSRIRISEDGLCQTLCSRMGTGGNQVPLAMTERKVYGISSDQSRAMLSKNPHAGIYEAETSRTLDCNGGSACPNQGGMLVVEPAAFAQNQREALCELGDQSGTISASPGSQTASPAYCMTTGSFTQLDEEVAPPIMARDFKDPPVVGRNDPAFALDRACFTSGENAQYRMNITEEKAPTLVAEG
ncbi:MAG: DNA cytosine methyltransferase, partial [Clostridia bacterium]|nr:DNA cytosine methyltransferase [Clostridia bacterium]